MPATLLKNPYVWAAGVAMVALPAMRPLLRNVPRAPAREATLPVFRLLTQDGVPFGNRDLEGHVFVVGLVSTRGHGVSTDILAAMRALQDRFERHAAPVRLLGVSHDPAVDTPRRLRALARAHGADPRRWTFLTGEPEDVRRVLVTGFGARPDPGVSRVKSLIDISDAGRLFIVDGSGGLRGAYRPDLLGLDEVFHRSQHVEREQRRNEH